MFLFTFISYAQTNPIITSWLRNTTGITGRHYLTTTTLPATPINDPTLLANVQAVNYNETTGYVYVSTDGIPAYVSGPFGNNPSPVATERNAVFRFPLILVPTPATTPVATTGGNIGVFINGVALFDYGDAFTWKASTSTDVMQTGDQVWKRDAVVAERTGFDCSKAHPAGGNYHHHQNPSAFNLDLVVISAICDNYASDGLYVINPSVHSPLIGFAYDGYPIYGPYAYRNVDGTGGIIRMKSSFTLRTDLPVGAIRSTYADGTNVADGPAVAAGAPAGGANPNRGLGYYREDYKCTAPPVATPDYLDTHNGRFCITPEYPDGMYCYFATVDENHNSAYPYVVGTTYYGNKVASNVNTVPAGTTLYNPTLNATSFAISNLDFKVYPNPTSDLISIQSTGLLVNDLKVEMIDELGKIVLKKTFFQGSATCYIETDTLYNGMYFIKISNQEDSKTFKVIVSK